MLVDSAASLLYNHSAAEVFGVEKERKQLQDQETLKLNPNFSDKFSLNSASSKRQLVLGSSAPRRAVDFSLTADQPRTSLAIVQDGVSRNRLHAWKDFVCAPVSRSVLVKGAPVHSYFRAHVHGRSPRRSPPKRRL